MEYANDVTKLLEIPGTPVLRNLLRGLRNSNPVICRKVKNIQMSDHVGDSTCQEPPALAMDMTVGELRQYVDLHDFERYIDPRDSAIPPLGMLPGGDEGQHGNLGHDLITFKQFGDEKCVTFFVECVKSCWDKQYHVGTPERGHWKHRKYGAVFSCDDTYKISCEGDRVLTATVVVCTYLYNGTGKKGQAQWGVQHKAKVAMFQYPTAPSKKTHALCDYMMGAISHVVHTLAHMEDGHRSGLGSLLPPEWDTVYIATGCGDNTPEFAHMFNADQTSTQDFIIQIARLLETEDAIVEKVRCD